MSTHLIPRLQQLVNEWLDLELPSTCSSMGSHQSVKVESVNNGANIQFTLKDRGNETEVAKLYLNRVNMPEVSGMVIPGNTDKAMSLMIQALEIANETN